MWGDYKEDSNAKFAFFHQTIVPKVLVCRLCHLFFGWYYRLIGNAVHTAAFSSVFVVEYDFRVCISLKFKQHSQEV